ncbi:MAG TPA: tagaturonate epimerase family protein [Pseudothermotoga sp.]
MKKQIGYFLKEFEKLTNGKYQVYQDSIHQIDTSIFFICRDRNRKQLVVIGKKGICERFEANKIGEIDDLDVVICQLSHKNCETIRDLFSLNPKRCNNKTSFGFGDRLGIATPAHALAAKNHDIFPIFAQQSVRELSRTQRTFKDALDSAVWGVFESGYHKDFGADADHVKQIEDLLNAAHEGYSMYTLDPSDHVRDIDKMSQKEIAEFYQSHPERRELESKYVGKTFNLSKQKLVMDEESFVKIFVTYIDVIKHVVKCYDALKGVKRDFDLEVSIDETSTPTTPLAHIFIAEELRRKGVDFQTLAPRFIGQWQKGIDYIGDLSILEKEMTIHGEIVKILSGYRLSLHSGSDKFSVYSIFAKCTEGNLHIKTAGTSYLEAIKVIAVKDAVLYRDIHRYALERFEIDRASYHVTTDLNKIPNVDKMSDTDLVKLFDIPDARQLIHITYGSILTAKESGHYLFKDRIFKVLFDNEKLHYEFVKNHMEKHLNLLKI